MMKRWSLIAMAGALLGVVSCTPMGGTFQGGSGATGSGARSGIVAGGGSATPVGTEGSSARATSGDLRQLREQREGMGSAQVINSGVGRSASGGVGLNSGGSSQGEGYEENLPPLPPMNIDYPYAIPVPGRKGWVFNHYTNRPVDVRGVESGRLIYDERDPANRNSDGTLKPVAEMPNKFRVP
ncbi:MAG: hypothetical protein ACSHYB_13535 [Roseibacillus sp.]